MPLATSQLIHPNLLDSLSPIIFNSLATIQEATESQKPSGEVIRTWSDIGNLTALTCAFAPISPGSPQHQERRQAKLTTTEVTHHATLSGYFPLINDTNRVQIYRDADGDEPELVANLNIISVEYDSHNTMTRLRLEILKT